MMSAQETVNLLTKLSSAGSSGGAYRSGSSSDGTRSGGINIDGVGNAILANVLRSAAGESRRTMSGSSARKCEDGDLRCQMTGSRAAAPAPLAGSQSLFVSTARRGNKDMEGTGLQGFSVVPKKTVLRAGDGNAYNSSRAPNVREGDCPDCSAVSQSEFMEKCVGNTNQRAALWKFSQCSLAANAQINQDAGARRIDSTSQRDGTQYNLTSTSTTDSSEGAGLAQSGSSMFRSRQARDPAGQLASAEPSQNTNKVGAL